MTGIAAPHVSGGAMASPPPRDVLTHVELTWVEHKIEYWISTRSAARSAERIRPATRGGPSMMM